MNYIKRHFNYSQGLSLVELMVAMTVSAILMLGISEIFSINSRSYKVQDENARMQESARFALNSLMTDIRRAGYFGGNATVTEITGSLGISLPATDCMDNDTTWGRMLEQPLYGLDDTNDGYDGVDGCIPDADYNDGLGGEIGGGDILVTRYSKGTPVDETTALADIDRLYIRNSMFTGTLFKGNTAANTSNVITETPFAIQELAASAYYVGPSGRNCRFNDSNGDPIPIPSLQREYLSNTGLPVAEEIASSIERIQFQYGIDTEKDNNANQYLNADDLNIDTAIDPNWKQVVSIRLWILVRAECPTRNYTNTKTYPMGDNDLVANDSFKRQIYSTTVAARN